MQKSGIRLTANAAATCIALACATANAQQRPASNMDAIPQLRLVEELRIGSATDPNVGFSRIGNIAVDRDAQLYVFENQDLEIRVYGSAGSLVRRIGRKGQGPGEFQTAARIGVKGDTVWASSPNFQLRGGRAVSAGTLTLFDRRNGAVIATNPLQVVEAPGRGNSRLLLSPMATRSDGTLISGSYLVGSASGASETGITATDPLPVPRVRFTIAGRVIDTIGRHIEVPGVAYPRPAVITTASGQRRVVPLPTPDIDLQSFFLEGRFTVQRPSAQSAAPFAFTVARENLRGATEWTRRYEYRPLGYSEDVLNEFARSSVVAVGPRVASAISTPVPDSSAAARAEIRRAMQFPQFQVPVRAIFVGEDGSLWIQREATARATERWDLIDPQGNPRGRIEMPRGVAPRWHSGDVLWAILRDGDDVPFLVRFRIGA